MTTIPLELDGRRPAVAWVTSLPGEWLTPAESLVLLVLACDSFDGKTAAPGYDNLAAWTHLQRSTVVGAIKRLIEGTNTRPPLLERVDGRGPRTTYRFLLTTESEEQRDRSAERPGRRGGPVGNTDRSGHRSGGRSDIRSSEPTGHRSARPSTPSTAPTPSPDGGSDSRTRRIAEELVARLPQLRPAPALLPVLEPEVIAGWGAQAILHAMDDAPAQVDDPPGFVAYRLAKRLAGPGPSAEREAVRRAQAARDAQRDEWAAAAVPRPHDFWDQVRRSPA